MVIKNDARDILFGRFGNNRHEKFNSNNETGELFFIAKKTKLYRVVIVQVHIKITKLFSDNFKLMMLNLSFYYILPEIISRWT